MVAVVAAVVALGIRVLGRSCAAAAGRRSRPPGRRVLATAAVAAAALPVATYLAGLVPWERAGAPPLALIAAVLVADLAVAALAVLGPWRRRRLGPPLTVLALTFATLVADVLTGSPWNSTGCWATTRSSPAGSPATATSPSGCWRSAR